MAIESPQSIVVRTCFGTGLYAQGRGFFLNAGETLRQGIEAAASGSPPRSEGNRPLREMEAIRRFVFELERARDIGQEMLAKGAKSTP